jgi:hypothetical protein
MQINTQHFDGFAYPAAEVKKFMMAFGIFTLSLQNGAIIHHHPKDTALFKAWLELHRVENLKAELVKH